MRASVPSLLETGPETEQETEVGRTPQQLDATKAGALVHLRAVVHLRERRFVERLKAKLLLKAEQQVYVLDVRRPSFLLQGRCLMQVEVVYPKKTMVFWCLYFDRETDAVVELFLNREKPIQDVIEQRFVEPLVERLKSELPKAEDPGPLTVPRQVGVIDVRTPSFLQDGYLVQVEVVYPDKTKMFWCLFFDSEKAAVVEPFLNRAETSIPDVIERITKARGTECIRIDPETVRDYVIEFMNYELADSGEAGLLLNDLDSRTFGVLDWPTPLLESEKKEVKKCLTTHSMQIDADTDYSLSVEACMVERDALVSREFRIFTKDNTGDDDPGRKGQVKPGKRDAYDPGRKGQVKPGKRDALVLLKGLPENCRAKRGASLGVPEVRFGADSEGWEEVPPEDVSSILSDLQRRIKPVLDPTQLGRWSRQHLACYDLDLLKIEPANSDEKWIAYIVREPGLALPLPLNSFSSPIHHFNEILGAERRSKSEDGRVIRTWNEAAAYAVFFSRHVWGSEGPFMVLKSKGDNAIRRLDWTDAEFNFRWFYSKDLALAAIAPPEVEPPGVQPGFAVAAWVLYGKTIYKATFQVRADGWIRMTKDEPMVEALTALKDGSTKRPDDEPMVSARVKDNAYPPNLPLECFIRPAELKPLMASKLELEREPGQSTVAENRVLTGQLTHETLYVRNFRRCRFRGRVNLHLLVSDHGLSFEECVFENGLDLSEASLKGTLSITQCLVVQGRHHKLIDTAQPFSFDGLSAAALHINGLWSTGSLIASGMRIHGAVHLINMTTLGGIDLTGLAAQSLHLSDMHAKDDIVLRHCVIEQSVDFQDVGTSKNVDLTGLAAQSMNFQDVGTGSLSASGVRIHGAVQLSRLRTLGRMDLSGLAAQSLDLSDTDAKEDINLQDCVIDQFIDFKNVGTDSSINLYGAVVTHNYVRFREVSVAGDLVAIFVRVGTGFSLESDAARGNTIKGSIELGCANLAKLLRIRNTRVGKSIKAKGVATAEVRILGGRLQDFETSPDLTDAEIDRRLQELFKASPDLTVAHLREFKTSPDLTDAEIDRRLQESFKAAPGLTVAEISRRLQEFKTSTDLTDAEIDRRLQEVFKASPDLTVAEISRRRQELFKTSPDLTVAEIDRRLQESFKASPGLTVAEIDRRWQEFKASPDLTVAEINRRLQEFKASHIGGFIDLTDAEIQHDVTLVDLAVGTDRDLAQNTNASLLLRNAKVGGTVRLFQTAKDAQAKGWLDAKANAQADFSGVWRHGLDLKNAAILGDVNLSGVQCLAGGISLEEAEIQRELYIRSGSGKRAKATYLAMTGLKCQGAADITGLELPECPRPWAGSPNGAVIADVATFAKKLIFAESVEGVERSARIPGRLDLSGSTIGELAVSVSSFDKKLVNDENWIAFGIRLSQAQVKQINEENLKTCGILLRQAQINKLSAMGRAVPRDGRVRSECGYPQPIDLSFSDIKWWEFREGNKSESDDAEDYLQLLKGDPNLQRHTFSSIEQNLFNRGHDDAADEVHKAMRKWLRGEATPKLGRWLKNRFRSVWDLLALCSSWLKNRFRWLRNPFRYLTLLGRWLRNCFRSVLDLLTLSKTSPWPLFLIVVFWTLFSVFGVFSNPANIEPSEAALIAHPEWRGVRVQPHAEWDRLAGVWMAVRFHVPVVAFTARGAWKPANAQALTVSLLRRSKWTWPGISPEDYANFVLALHCLIWPMIIVIGSRKFFMRLSK